MKRKLFLFTAIILTCSLFLTAGKQADIGEQKAKELALTYINKLFGANETDATVEREQLDCLPAQAGAIRTDDADEAYVRWVYHVQVLSARSLTKYEMYIVASTGEWIVADQSEAHIILSDEQKARADSLYKEGPSWGKKHQEAEKELYQACYDWSVANLDDQHPILLDTDPGKEARGALLRTTAATYYIVTRNNRVYALTMQWPSLQVLSIDVINPK